jgi:D-glycero-alpha-D-manno-heptose-7-phosphate kinase
VTTDLQDRLLYFYTGLTRSASALLHQQSTEMVASKEKLKAMGEMVRLAEAAYTDLCEGRIDALGSMLHEAWQIKKQMTDGISNALIDEAYDAAIAAGAEGGKLLGAGGGGFLMFLAPPERHDAIRGALSRLRETPFRFAAQGSSIIFVH